MKRNRATIILKNTASNYLRQFVMLGVFLALTPFIAAQLGKERFGLWSLIQAAVGLFALADLGFSVSVVKFVADARGRDDAARLKQLTSTFFWVYAALGGAMMAVAAGVLPALPKMLSIPPEHAADARIVFMLVASRAALAMPFGMFYGVLTGFQRQSTANMFRMGGTILYAGLAFWALTSRPSVRLLAEAVLAAHLFACVAATLFCLARLDGVTISPRFFRWGMVREIHSFSWYFFLIQVSALVYMRVDSIIIQTFFSLSAVAVYTVAARVAENASTFCRQLTNALTPMIAELKGAGEEANIRAVFQKGAKLNVALAMPLLGGLMHYTEPLLRSWMGEEFVSATSACQILLLAMLVSVAYASASNVLSMTGHQRAVAFAFAGGQVLNLLLTFLFVVFTELGVGGVALATLVSTLVCDAGVIASRACLLHGVTPLGYIRLAIWPSIPPLGAMLGALWLVEHVLPPTDLARIAALELLGCGVFAAVFALVGLNSRERRYYRDRLGRVFNGARSRSGALEEPQQL